MKKNKHFWALLTIVLLGGIIYANSLNNSFLWDDIRLIVENDFIKDWKNIFKVFSWESIFARKVAYPNMSRPVTVASNIIDYRIWKLNPFGFHVTNILLHLFNACLIYWWVWLILDSRRAAFLSGILFVTHPLHTEVVNGISFRADALALFFFLLSFNLFLNYLSKRKKSRRERIAYSLSIIGYLLALLSKSMAITLPVVLLLYEFFSKKKLKYSIARYLPYFVLAVLFIYFHSTRFHYAIEKFAHPGIFSSQMAYAAENKDILTDIKKYDVSLVYKDPAIKTLTMSRIFTHYIRLLFLPRGLKADYAFPPARSLSEPLTFMAVAVIIFLILSVFFFYHRIPLLSYSIAAFFVMLLPVSNIIPIVNIVAERYLYLPSINFFLMVGFGLDRLARKINKRVMNVTLLILVIVFSISVVMRNRIWRDDFTFFSKMVEQSPRSFRGRYNLGLVYQRKGLWDKAQEEYVIAVQLRPHRPDIHNNLGICHEKKGKLDSALEEYKITIELAPHSFQGYNNLGNIYQKKGEIEKAIQEYQVALSLEPDFAPGFNNLGIAYSAKGDQERAINYFKKALEIDPDYEDALANLEEVVKGIK